MFWEENDPKFQNVSNCHFLDASGIFSMHFLLHLQSTFSNFFPSTFYFWMSYMIYLNYGTFYDFPLYCHNSDVFSNDVQHQFQVPICDYLKKCRFTTFLLLHVQSYKTLYITLKRKKINELNQNTKR